MSFHVFHGLNCWRWWEGGLDAAVCHFVEGGGESSFRSSQTRLCFCSPLNTGVVILYGLTHCYPSYYHIEVWVVWGLKGKLMLLHTCMLICFYLFLNSWYLLMFLSISILTTISLFVWTLVVTPIIVSNRLRHYTLTAGSVVLHIIIVVVVCFVFPLISIW